MEFVVIDGFFLYVCVLIAPMRISASNWLIKLMNFFGKRKRAENFKIYIYSKKNLLLGIFGVYYLTSVLASVEACM